MRGHIRRRGTASWELKFDLGRDPVTGKRLTRYQSFRGTKREAEKRLVELLGQADNGGLVRPSHETVGAFLDRWVPDWVHGNVTPKTGERYAELLALHVMPRLGSVTLQRLRPAAIGQLYATLLREGGPKARGLAPRTIGQVHRVLHKALAIAVDWDLLRDNPVDRVKPPRVAAAEIEILSEAQARDVLEILRGKTDLSDSPDVDRAWYFAAALALATGLRRGELLALTWGKVDVDSAKIRVERSLEETKAGLRFKQPKTRHGRRMISLPPWIVRDLEAYRRVQLEERLRLGLGKLSDDALLFPAEDGDSPRSPDKFSKGWARVVARSKLPRVTFHALRHTHVSQLIASGMDVLTISRRLGHSSPTITLNVYGHLFSNTDDQAAQIMERAFGGRSGSDL
jgi:integrase